MTGRDTVAFVPIEDDLGFFSTHEGRLYRRDLITKCVRRVGKIPPRGLPKRELPVQQRTKAAKGDHDETQKAN